MHSSLAKVRHFISSLAILSAGVAVSIRIWLSLTENLQQQLEAGVDISRSDTLIPVFILIESIVSSFLISVIYYYLSTSQERDLATIENVRKQLHASEEQNRTIVTNINVGIYRFDINKDGTFLNVNPALAKMLDYASAESLTGKKMSEFFRMQADWNNFVEAIKKDGIVNNIEFQLKKMSGKLFWASISSKAHHTNNKVDWVDGFLEDISTRKEYEMRIAERTNELEEARSKDEAILSSISDGVFVVDKDQRILLFNPSAENLSGLASSDVLGKKFFEVLKFGIEDGESVSIDYIDKSLKTGIPQEGPRHMILTKNDGSVTAIGSSASPLKATQDEITGCVVVLRSVDKERAMDKVKTEFVSLASHQLRTPLSTINWYTEMLLDGDFGKMSRDQKKYLGEIYRTNQRMINLINALLNVSRMEMGTFAIEPEPVNLSVITKNALSELQEKIQTKRLEITIDIHKDVPLIPLDPKLIHIVFQNLFSNAVKYTPPEGKISIRITTTDPILAQYNKDGNDSVLIAVHDTGIGIPSSTEKKIFSKMFRADNAKENDPDGNGLGLYLTKSIIEHSDGYIWFESKENVGTSFFVVLPLGGMKKKAGNKKLA